MDSLYCQTVAMFYYITRLSAYDGGDSGGGTAAVGLYFATVA